MAAMPKVMSPLLDGLADKNDVERLQQLAQYIVLSTGSPIDWGCNPQASPTDFGLASSNTSTPYVLDADKVTRLNSQNTYYITYAQLLNELKVSDIALNINIQPVFNTSINLISSTDYGNGTNYIFEITTQNSGLAVVSDMNCYLIAGNFVASLTSFTNSTGKGIASFVVPVSVNGSGLLIVFAKAQSNPSIASFGVFSLENDSSVPASNDTFATLNPLDNRLNASFNYPNEQTLGAYALSYSYWTNLTMLSNMTQTAEYSFPCFLDQSITVLVLTGLNGTEPFAQWAAYPQIPLDIGVNFNSLNSEGSIASFTYFVTIGLAIYKMQIACKEVG
jgi:hypothetical protein